MSSQTVTEVELTVVELIKPHVVTQLELLLWMMAGEHAAHWKAEGEPRWVEVIPQGKAQVSLHWLIVPLTQ